MAEESSQDKPIVLTKGSKYRVVSLESREAPLVSHGEFIGYTAIGTNEGMCVRLDESHKEATGRLRIIPTHMIISIDVIKAAEPEKEKSKEPTAMFG
jgi:hypothetical protein